jgi:uncharacterized iron-regulated protein
MYERAFAEASETLNGENASISKYAIEFDRSLPDTFKSVRMRRISNAIDNHNVILFGDFHSHKQCQRALLRVIRTYNNTPDHAPIVLALEMFRSDDQPTLDEWQDGKISDEVLLEKTKYDTIWGFPWSNYKPLMDYCRHHSIPLVAANTANAGKDSLKTRDEHAAKIIKKLSAEHSTAKIFFIVGEYHLADAYMPQELKALGDFSILRIIANSDKYFFQMPDAHIHLRDVFLELNEDFFCILNSPPWIKWHSQTLVEELRIIGSSAYISSEIENRNLEDDYDVDEYEDDFTTEDSLDVDGYLKQSVDNIAKFLKLRNSSRFHDSFKVAQDVNNDDLSHLPEHAQASILAQSTREGVAADFGRRTLFMSEFSVNKVAFSAGLIIFGSLSNLKENYDNAEELFITQTLKFTFGYLANKILNPRISLHTEKEILDYLGATRGKHMVGQGKLRRDVARATIKFFDWAASVMDQNPTRSFSSRAVPLDIIHTDARSAHDVSRHVAQTITSTLYKKLVSGRIDVVEIARWYSRRCHTSVRMRVLLAELIELVRP